MFEAYVRELPTYNIQEVERAEFQPAQLPLYLFGDTKKPLSLGWVLALFLLLIVVIYRIN